MSRTTDRNGDPGWITPRPGDRQGAGGAAPDEAGIPPASWRTGDPGIASPVGPDSPHEVAIAIVVAIVIAVASGATWLTGAGRSTGHRSLPPATHPAVLIVPIGDVPIKALAPFPGDYRAEYGLTLAIAPAIPLPLGAYDARRGQFVAEGLIDAMAAAHPEESGGARILIAITAEDIYIRDIDWQWAFAKREGGRLAVISTARMSAPGLADPWLLLRKMLTRELGFLCFGLNPSDDPDDILYRNILGLDDLVRIGDHL